MSKFKPGDKVRRIANYDYSKLFNDKVFTVLDIAPNGYIYLKECSDKCWIGAYFELVSENKQKRWLVNGLVLYTLEAAKSIAKAEGAKVILEVELVAEYTLEEWTRKEL